MRKFSNGGGNYGGKYERKKWGNDKKDEEIILRRALTLLILMGSGTCCALKVFVVIKPIPLAYMSSTDPIHQHYHANYLPLIPSFI